VDVSPEMKHPGRILVRAAVVISIGLRSAGSLSAQDQGGWERPDDTVGAAVVVNGLSSPHRDYLAAGGLGFLLGDGRLAYGLETIVEFYYQARFFKSLFVSFDSQFVDNPGYNRDRGPVSIFGVRGHVEF
jgi:high affinity Mn2+ porin